MPTLRHEPLLSVRDLSVNYPLSGGRRLLAIDGVSFSLVAGETLAVVGESGCGKSTLARAICGLTPASGGEVRIGGKPTGPAPRPRDIGRHLQYVFQDPLDALDPRMTIAAIVEEPLRALQPSLSRAERRQRVEQILRDVGLSPAHLQRYPHEFSGGQAQRIAIARALVAEPSILICDEPVSALDVSVQAQIVNLLQSLQRQRGLAMLFISHDLRVVRHLADRVLVLYLGRLMESGPADEVFANPRHPYTRALLEAVPLTDPGQERQRIERLRPLAGDLPSPLEPPSGCVFRTRCPDAIPGCASFHPTPSNDPRVVNCMKT